MTGFQSPNYTQVPNDLFEKYMADMGNAELRVVLAITRQTIGFHIKDHRTKYSIQKLMTMTGLSRNGVKSGAAAAEQRGLLRRLNPDDQGSAEWELIVLPPSATDPPQLLTPSATDPLPPQQLTHSVGLKESIKENTTTTGADEHFGKLVQKMESIRGAVNTSMVNILTTWLEIWEEHTAKLPEGHPNKSINAYTAVSAAIDEAVDSAKDSRPNNKYIRAILDRWIREGFKSRRQHEHTKRRTNGKNADSQADYQPNELTEYQREMAERIKEQRKRKREGTMP